MGQPFQWGAVGSLTTEQSFPLQLYPRSDGHVALTLI